jgi:nicotinamide mononucleotide transporter
MRIRLLDNITGKWSLQWIVFWFISGLLALSAGFWLTTEHTGLDWFYLGVSIIGLVCVVSLAFRKNLSGNGFGMAATAGEFVVQGPELRRCCTTV